MTTIKAVGTGGKAKTSTRNATATDAKALGDHYTTAIETDKALKRLIRDAKERIGTGQAVDLDAIASAVKGHFATLVETRESIGRLPANTRAAGGATRQSVVMQTYGQVNRDLGARLTPASARDLNRASFGK